MNESLFFAEEKTISQAKSTINKIDILSVDEIKSKFHELLKGYATLFKQFRRLIKLSDKQQLKLNELNEALEVRNQFIKKTFGRYLSDDIVNALLETPDGLEIGGEKKVVTIMMTDLRGFTALCETLSPEDVLTIINIYLEVMSAVVLKYNGTIDEIIGDGLFIVFGAPIKKDDDAKRSVACALEMQLAMHVVNQKISELGFPELELGIGLNTGEVVVGNIGSQFRTKYGLIGSNVNLTARIESYSIGGQVLISDNTLKACGDILIVNQSFNVLPKGLSLSINIHEIIGINEPYNKFLPQNKDCEMLSLERSVAIFIYQIKEKQIRNEKICASIIKLAKTGAVIHCEANLELFSNIKISLVDNNTIIQNLYAKVVKNIPYNSAHFQINFTSVPPDAHDFFKMIMTS